MVRVSSRVSYSLHVFASKSWSFLETVDIHRVYGELDWYSGHRVVAVHKVIGNKQGSTVFLGFSDVILGLPTVVNLAQAS